MGGSGETILIVDDSPDQRKIASKTLTRLGYGTVVLPGGEAAVAYLETESVDLVILDMIMEGGIDGAETLRRIMRIKPGQKAVIASGYARNRMVESALALGNCLYIRKPYSLREIAAVIKKALSSHNPGPAG